MKFRNRSNLTFQLNMTPMIDVVFLLIIFFMCTLTVSEPEGDFEISLPFGSASANSASDAELQPFKVRMEADAQGELVSLSFDGENLGGGPNAISSLNSRVFRRITGLQAIGSDQLEKQEVEIDPDYNLNYRYIINAIRACSGRVGHNGVHIPYLQRIKFAPIRHQQ